MRDQRSANRMLGILALVLTGLVIVRALRRRWTDHDVSDPGVSL